MKHLTYLAVLALMCACTSNKQEELPACDAAMFGLGTDVEEVACYHQFDDYEFDYYKATFDADGNVIVPDTDKAERDEKGRIVRYETNYANPDYEDYILYELEYDNDTFQPSQWSYGCLGGMGVSKLIYDGTKIIGSNDSNAYEGGGGEDKSELKYEYVEFDDHGNWTKRKVTGVSQTTEYQMDDDFNEVPVESEQQISYTEVRTIKYRK